jgi:hypothetical protein
MKTPRKSKKVSPRFETQCRAWVASHDLRFWAEIIHKAALADDKLFFYYLDQYLRNKQKRLPLSVEHRKLLSVDFQNPDLSAEEKLKQLRLEGGTGFYGVTKQRAIARATLILEIMRRASGVEIAPRLSDIYTGGSDKG